MSTTYYVDTHALNASDSNAGSSTAPWKTLNKANNVAASGDTVIVRAGTYAESVSVKVGSVAWLAEADVIIDAAGLTTGFTVAALTGVTIQGFDIRNAPTYGILIQGGGGHIIRYNKVSACTSGGIRLQPQSPQLFQPTDNGAGGTLTAGTKFYAVSAIIGGLETLPSFVLGVTIAANHTVQVQWSKIPAATSFNVYGRTQTGATKIINVANSFGAGFPTWIDDGSLSPDGVTLLPQTSGVLMTTCIVEGNEVHDINSHGIYLFGANAVQVRGNDCHHNRLHGIALLNASNDNVVEFNRSYLNSTGGSRISNGIQCDGFGIGTPGSARNVIQDNACFRNEDSGISIYNGSIDCIVRRNISYANGDHGFDNLGATGCHFIGNTAYRNVAAGFNSEGGSLGVRVRNNISADNGINSPRTSGNYRCDPTVIADAELDNNVSWLTVPAASQPTVPGLANCEMTWGNTLYKTLALYQAAVPDQMVNGVSGDPKFTDPDNGNFHIGTGSAASQLATPSAPDHLASDYYGTASGATPDAGAIQQSLTA